MSSMCGRFTLRTPAAELAEIFELLRLPDWSDRFNIAPTQPVLAIRQGTSGRASGVLRWGLVPSWANDIAIGSRMINARGETLAQKPSFRTAFKRRRCVIPADGFFEWAKTSSRTKQPYYITPISDHPFAFAGLWEKWSPADGSEIETCTIITTTANEILVDIHERMPVILCEADIDRWLDPENQSTADLQSLLVPCAENDMERVAVSTFVNSPRNDTPKCIEPLDSG
jgi:putative SOS response-associated peptidase YedK